MVSMGSQKRRTFKSVFLTKKVLLGGILDRHVAAVDTEPRLIGGAAHVVVRSARVPDHQVARVGTNLDPFVAVVGKPLQAGFLKSVPFVGPGWNALFGFERLVVLRTGKVSALGNNKPSIVRTVG